MLPPTERSEALRRRLRLVRWLAIADALLLAALLTASLTGQRELVRLLGPLHGGNFLALLVVVATGAIDRLWSWWFPVGIIATFGPLGAFIGEWLIRRRLARDATPALAVVGREGEGPR